MPTKSIDPIEYRFRNTENETNSHKDVCQKFLLEEAQCALSEEMTHSFKHKSNYETMKSLFTNLYNSYIQLETKLAETINDAEINQKKQVQVIRNMQNRLKLYEKESSGDDELLITPEKLESLKLLIKEQLAKQYYEQMMVIQSSAQILENDNTMLMHEITILNKTLETERQEHRSEVERRQLLYEAEISNLKSIKDNLLKRIRELSGEELVYQNDICKENAHLQTQCKLLLDELEDIKRKVMVERERLISQNLELSNKVTELKLSNSELEAECKTLKSKVNFLNKEVDDLRNELTTQANITSQAHRTYAEAERQLSQTNQITQQELCNLRIEVQRQRSLIENQQAELLEKSQVMEKKLNLLNKFTDPSTHSIIPHNFGKYESETKACSEFLTQMVIFDSKIHDICKYLDNEASEIKAFQVSTKLSTEPSADTIDNNDIVQTRTHDAESIEYGVNELETQLKSTKEKFRSYIERSNKKKRALCMCIKKLKEKIEELYSENQQLRNSIPKSDFDQVQAAFQDLKRRHEKYERIILGSNSFDGDDTKQTMQLVEKFFGSNIHADRDTL